jgi:hypothetical protein
MHRRSSPLLVIGLLAAVAACNNLTGLQSANGTPVGIVLMNARTKAGGYTTYPKVNFYSVASATFSTSSVNTDTCVVSPYDSTAGQTTNALQIGGGAFVIAAVSGNTDTLYKAATGDQTYHPSSAAGMAFIPGDSVSFSIGGDAAGFPQMQVKAKTAEPFSPITPNPVLGQPMLVNWQPAATDNNSAMYISLLYNSPINNLLYGTGLNTQILCDFNDDGQGAVKSYLLPSLVSSNVPWVMHAQRVRSNLIISTTTPAAYLNIVSTFEWPTPVSP